MNEQNTSRITTVFLLGFQTNRKISCLIFILFLLIYCVSLCGNLLIITLVSYCKTIQSPMYFFLSQLAVSDILLATNILPNTLHQLLVKEKIISFNGCITQMYIFILAEGLEYFVLTVMSYDRYLAICKPLHYTLIMHKHLSWILVSVCWTLGASITLSYIITIAKLQFCGPNVIDHFFCDVDPILQLSCSDTTSVRQEITFYGATFFTIPFFIIIISYIYIILTILQIPSVIGKEKAFSTCSSHLSVVFTYFESIVCVYYVPSVRQSMDLTKFVPLLYTAGTPLINPIIYSLRNKDFKHIIKNKLIALRINREIEIKENKE